MAEEAIDLPLLAHVSGGGLRSWWNGKSCAWKTDAVGTTAGLGTVAAGFGIIAKSRRPGVGALVAMGGAMFERPITRAVQRAQCGEPPVPEATPR